MTTVVFVHGGGVRDASFALTCKFIQQVFVDQAIASKLAFCFWGVEHGSKPPDLCIPEAELRGKSPNVLTSAQKVERWSMLYRDRLAELRLLKTRPNAVARPSQRQGVEIWAHIEAYVPSSRLRDFLEKWQLAGYWDRAWRYILVENETAKEVLVSSGADFGEPAECIGRALVAELTILALADSVQSLDGDHRDELVNLLITDWKGRDGGVNHYVGSLLADVRTPAGRTRGQPFDATTASLGDVLLYQARGEAIRKSIECSIAMAMGADNDSGGGRVVLLAHSLGGVASVDLLATKTIPCVTHLITVGSQSPYLYEIGALHGLDVAKQEKLPPTFPRWLNLYDPYDFLSYVAEPVFQSENVRDVRIESGQPFPESHGAYWTNNATWRAIKQFLDE